MQRLERELEVAKAAVKAAAIVCRRVQDGLTTAAVAKGDKSPVTIADFASQAVVCERLMQAYPNDAVVGEEDSGLLRENAQLLEEVHGLLRGVAEVTPQQVLAAIDRGQGESVKGAGQRFWTLDPIDGTKGFLRKEQYAIALALIEDGEVVLAALGCPRLEGPAGVGALLCAVRGQGATLEALFTDSDTAPVRVSTVSESHGLRFCESVESGHSAHDVSARIVESLGVRAQPVRLDSQAKYGVVARGEAEVYLRIPTRAGYEEKIWDHAAGACLVEEAGGRVTDIDGRPLDFGCGRTLANNRGIVASHGLQHDAILDAVRAASR